MFWTTLFCSLAFGHLSPALLNKMLINLTIIWIAQSLHFYICQPWQQSSFVHLQSAPSHDELFSSSFHNITLPLRREVNCQNGSFAHSLSETEKSSHLTCYLFASRPITFLAAAASGTSWQHDPRRRDLIAHLLSVQTRYLLTTSVSVGPGAWRAQLHRVDQQ
jgi:hypothetical protein